MMSTMEIVAGQSTTASGDLGGVSIWGRFAWSGGRPRPQLGQQAALQGGQRPLPDFRSAVEHRLNDDAVERRPDQRRGDGRVEVRSENSPLRTPSSRIVRIHVRQ